MFWGLVLKANKRYSQQVTKAFHVSQATLDLNTLNANDSDALVQVWLHTDDTDHLLANVSRQSSHVRLDLAFTEGETVAFYSKGNGTVHLSGYLIPDDDDFGDFPLEGEEEEEEEDSDQEVESPAAAKKQNEKGNKKQIKVGKDEEDEEDDDDESDDLDFDGLNHELEDDDLEDEEDSEADDDDESEDDDDEDDDEEDEEDSDDEVEAPPAKLAKFEKGAKQNGLPNGKAAKQENDAKQKNQQQQQQQNNKKQEKQENQKNQQQKTTPKTLAGGVIIEDIRVGKGPEAKSGRKVNVYYEGRLKSNNKVFDSTKAGNGFQFALGRGEVIRGWDIGVVGMKVGSKRRITCPPNVAYGHKGAPPAIPGNATLVFDVELRGVK